ncbi:MAG: hypothetical protein IPI23_13405 [Bacteroidetes bacterium]|nr:hypothetical protein [Bacteroidota bacterium]
MDGIINELATVIQNYLAEHQFGIPDWFAKVVVYIFISIIIFLASKIGKKAFQYFQTLKKSRRYIHSIQKVKFNKNENTTFH